MTDGDILRAKATFSGRFERNSMPVAPGNFFWSSKKSVKEAMTIKHLIEWLTPKRIAVVLGIVLIVYFSRTVIAILFPFAAALFIAAVLEPIIAFLERRGKLLRPWAVMTTLTGTVILFGYLVVNVFTKLITELNDLVTQLPQHREAAAEAASKLLDRYEQFHESLPEVIRANLHSTFLELLRSLEAGSREFINEALNALASLPVVLVVTLVIIAAAYFISKDKDLLTRFFMGLVPKDHQDRFEEMRKRIAVDLIGYIKGRILMLLIASGIAAVGFVLIGTRYWLILALIIGILDNIPIVGPGAVFGPWVAVAIALGDFNRAVFLTVLYFVIFAFRQLVEPKVMGDSIGIHPLAMLLALYGGIVAFGVIGIVVGPVLAIIIKAVFRHPRPIDQLHE